MCGHVFAIGHAADGDVAIYRLENKAVAGDFKLTTEGVGSNRPVKDAIEAAFRFFENNAGKVAAGMRATERDYLMFYNDLQKKGLSVETSLAEFVGLCSAACNRPVVASMVIPGTLRMSGTIDEIRDLEDILRVAKNAGARKVLLPAQLHQGFAERPLRASRKRGTRLLPGRRCRFCGAQGAGCLDESLMGGMHHGR